MNPVIDLRTLANLVKRIRVSGELDCWEWTMALDGDGYGITSRRAQWKRAHRLSYELFVGPIPEGKQLDHLCRNRKCIRPDHLEAVSPRENTMRGNTPAFRNFAKTHCIRGHAFDATNTYVWKNKRTCRACHAAYARIWNSKHALA